MMNRILAFCSLALLVGAFAFASCGGESSEDQAKSDGKTLGEAVRSVFQAQSLDELDSAVSGVEEAQAALGESFGAEEQAEYDQVSSTIDSILKDVRTAVSADSEEEALDAVRSAAGQLDQLAEDIEQFREGAGSIVKAALDGFVEGLGL